MHAGCHATTHHVCLNCRHRWRRSLFLSLPWVVHVFQTEAFKTEALEQSPSNRAPQTCTRWTWFVPLCLETQSRCCSRSAAAPEAVCVQHPDACPGRGAGATAPAAPGCARVARATCERSKQKLQGLVCGAVALRGLLGAAIPADARPRGRALVAAVRRAAEEHDRDGVGAAPGHLVRLPRAGRV